MSSARRLLRSRFLLPCIVAGCAAPPPAPREIAIAVLPPPTPAPSASPSASASALPDAAPATKRRFVIEDRSAPDDIDVDSGAAPCDFARSYRGTIGETKVTLLLRAPSVRAPGSPLAIEGFSHYDTAAPAIAITGSRAADGSFVISEKAGGALKGRCEASTGVLKGRFTLGKRDQAFELSPRPADWPGLYRVRRSAMTRPNHPICNRAALPDRVIEISIEPDQDYPRAICLPSSPAKRRQVLADAPDLGCSAVDTGYRVFGLAKPSIEKTINGILAGGMFEDAVKEIRVCSGERSSYRSMSLIAAGRDILAVSSFSSQDYGGAHPMNAGIGGMAFSLRDGAQIDLKDIIIDDRRMRDLAGACLPIYAQAAWAKDTFELEPRPPATCGNEGMSARYLWSCDKDDLDHPNWALLPEGVVIGSWANPHVSASEDGQGPILSWAVLKREGLLKPGSPVDFLWANVPAAGPDALACGSAFRGDVLRAWRENPSP